jgi:hypothetical protein
MVPATFLFSLDGKQYRCEASAIAAVSPVVREQVGRSILTFQFTGLCDPHTYFPVFLNLLSGLEIDVNFENAFFLNAIGQILNIQPLSLYTSRVIDSAMARLTPIALLRNLGEHGLDTESTAQFVITHWSEFEANPEILTLPFRALDDLFDNENFEPSSEIVLFNLICNLVEKRGREFVTLLRHIRVATLDPAEMRRYIDIVSFDEIPSLVIAAIDDRLVCDIARPDEEFPSPGLPPVHPPISASGRIPAAVPISAKQAVPAPIPTPTAGKPTVSAPIPTPISAKPAAPPPMPASNSTKPTVPPPALARSGSAPTQVGRGRAEPPRKVSIFNPTVEFRFLEHYDRERIIDGVFREITREQRHEWSNYVYLTGGGTKEKMLAHLFEFDPDHLFEYHWDNYDAKEKIKPANAWLQVQFPFHTFVMTHYTIATSGKQFPFNSQPRSWNMEGSADGKNWIVLAQVRRDDRFREQTMALATFPVPKIRQPFSYFKLTQIENFAKQGAPNFGEMRINALEFYGILYKR